MVNIQKCAIIGCGFVGASIAFSLAEDGIFSELVLIDANRDKAEGEAMDISHGIPLLKPAEVYAGDYSDLADCSLIIITAGTGQKPNETRLDLVHRNVEIMKDIVSNIIKFNTEAILLIVSNPVDILTYVALKYSGFPQNRVIGSGTVLDTARLKYMIGKHLGVDSRSVHMLLLSVSMATASLLYGAVRIFQELIFPIFAAPAETVSNTKICTAYITML